MEIYFLLVLCALVMLEAHFARRDAKLARDEVSEVALRLSLGLSLMGLEIVVGKEVK